MKKLGMSETEADDLLKRATPSFRNLGEVAFEAGEYDKAVKYFDDELKDPYLTERQEKIIRELKSICYINLACLAADHDRKENLWTKATAEFEKFADINNEAWTKKPLYFVRRKIFVNAMVSGKIFCKQTERTDKFAFTGFHNKWKMQNYAHRQILTMDDSDYFESKFNSNNFLLDENVDWNKFTRAISAPVHHIHYEKDLDQLRFIKSKGSIENIRRFLFGEREYLEVKYFVNFLSENKKFRDIRVICIADSPGMDKTFLLREINRVLKNTFPERVVLLVDFRAIFLEIKRNPKTNCAARLIGEITKYIYKENRGRQLLVNEFENSRELRFELLLDGLDELLQQDIEFALSCLYELKEKYFNSTRIWVASQRHYLTNIKDKVQVLAYRVDPFPENAENDQICLLAKFWLTQKREGNFQHFKEFAKRCLSAIKPHLNINNFSQAFGEIPKQCYLIAEVFMKYAPGFPDSGKYDFENVAPMPLYESLIENRITKYLGTTDRLGFSDKIERLRRIHIHLALKTIFPREIENLDENYNITAQDIEEVLKVGILRDFASTLSGTKDLQFIHRTFAEYFVASFLAEKINSPDNFDSLFREVLQTYLDVEYIQGYKRYDFEEPEFRLWKFSHSTICFFLDCLVNNLNKNELFVNENEVNKTRLLEHQTAQACIFHNFTNLLQMKAIYFKNRAPLNTNTGHLPLLAVKFSCVEVLKWIYTGVDTINFPPLNTLTCHRIVSLDEMHNICLSTILPVAVYRGCYKTVQYLLEHHGFKGDIENLVLHKRRDKRSSLNFLLCYCVMDTIPCNSDEISNRINILKHLVGIQRSLLDTTNLEKETPLMSRGVHHLLLIEMLRLGANQLAQSYGGHTFLRLAARFLTPECFQNLLEAGVILKENLKILVKVDSSWRNGNTLLHTLVEESCPSLKTLQILSDHEADFNTLNYREYSVLDKAVISLWEGISSDVETKRRKELCLNLLAVNADTSNPQKRTKLSVLHTAISFHSQHLSNSNFFKMLTFLITDMKCDVCAKDASGRTPLDLLLTLPHNPVGTFEAANIIYEYMPNIPFDEELLYLTIKIKNTDAAQFILNSASCPIDCKKKFQHHNNNTLLHLACQNGPAGRGSWELQKVLLEKGADINATNDNRETPLECLLRHENDHARITPESLRILHPAQTRTQLRKLVFSWLETNHNFLIQNDKIGETLDFLVSKNHIIDEENGNTLLHMAATWSQSDGVKHLLNSQVMQNTFKVNVRNKHQKTPLYLSLFSAKNTSLETVDLLLKHDSTFENLTGKLKSLPIQLFKLSPRQSYEEKFEILKVFLSNHCNMRDIDDDGNSVFNYVFTSKMQISPGQFHDLILLMNENNCLDLLSRPQKNDGVTPLHTIVKFLEIENATLQILGNSQLVNFNAVTSTGKSVLCYAVEGHRSKAFLKNICSDGFCDWKKSENETTEKCNIIHHAAYYGTAEALNFFLNMDTKANLGIRYAKNIYGQNAMYFAIKRKMESIGGNKEWEKNEKKKIIRLLDDEGIIF